MNMRNDQGNRGFWSRIQSQDHITGAYIGTGIAIGVAIGAVLGNIVVGVAVGVSMGIMMEAVTPRRH